jgi:hypothetical protein
MESPQIRIVRRDEWKDLPIQPPAGYFQWIANYVVRALLLSLAVFAPGAIIASARHEAPKWIWVVAGIAMLECAAALVLAVLAFRPYRAERKLGYTTWPSVSEIKNATRGKETR